MCSCVCVHTCAVCKCDCVQMNVCEHIGTTAYNRGFDVYHVIPVIKYRNDTN